TGQVVEQAEVEVVPRVLVGERDVGRTRTGLVPDRHPHEHQETEYHDEDDDQRNHATSSMLRAISVSRSVRPPSSCDVSATRTVRQRMSRSGWWFDFSARKPIRTTKATASANDGRSYDFTISSPSRPQPGSAASAACTSASERRAITTIQPQEPRCATLAWCR